MMVVLGEAVGNSQKKTHMESYGVGNNQKHGDGVNMYSFLFQRKHIYTSKKVMILVVTGMFFFAEGFRFSRVI